jgi:N-acetylglucosamine-6-phosphate deacetylase
LNIDELKKWQELSEGAIKLITIAPETSEDNGSEFIKAANELGILVSIGHTDASYEQAKNAIANGITHCTHLFNAMPPIHHRKPGAIGAILESESVYVELIADGVHVHPSILRMACKAVGYERVILITDAISGADMPDGKYSLGDQEVFVSNGTAQFADGTLAGSVLNMNKAFSNIQEFLSIDPATASMMTSGNAARHLGVDDKFGTIEVGKRADLVVLNKENLQAVAVMRDGKWIHQSKLSHPKEGILSSWHPELQE